MTSLFNETSSSGFSVVLDTNVKLESLGKHQLVRHLSFNEFHSVLGTLPSQLADKVQKWFFNVVKELRRNFVVLKVLNKINCYLS
jgi:hypothetical protein